MEHRACTYSDKDLFFSENDPSRLKAKMAELEAKQICRTCPVQVECLEAALAADEFGIWGGTNRDERRKMKKAGRASRVRADRPSTP
jgi:WhiB family redox-sensing transcriptional regulator